MSQACVAGPDLQNLLAVLNLQLLNHPCEVGELKWFSLINGDLLAYYQGQMRQHTALEYRVRRQDVQQLSILDPDAHAFSSKTATLVLRANPASVQTLVFTPNPSESGDFCYSSGNLDELRLRVARDDVELIQDTLAQLLAAGNAHWLGDLPSHWR